MNDNRPRSNNNYNSPSGKSIADFFGIALVFMFAGFIMGLLFAPQSGTKTRGVLMDKIAELIDRSKFAMLEARVKGEEFLEISKEKIEKASSRAKDNK